MGDQSSRGMGFAGVIASGVVLGYIAFELYALHSARERMEPAQIYTQFVRARQAVNRCDRHTAQRDDFERNFAAVTRRALRDLREQQPDLSPAQLEEMLRAQQQGQEREVDALIAEQGCEGQDLWRLIRLYEVRSRLNLR